MMLLIGLFRKKSYLANFFVGCSKQPVLFFGQKEFNE